STLTPGGVLAAHEAQKGADWFGGPHAETVELFFRVVLATATSGDPLIGKRLPALVREAGFVRLEATPGYSVALSHVKCAAALMLSSLERQEFRAAALEYGISAERLDCFGKEISSWADSADSVAAFAGCNVIGWKP